MTSEELEILFHDEVLVAINKPEGLLVHRSEIDRRETRFALQLLRDQIGQRVFPLHRLDKPTSGVLLFALDSATAKIMGAQIMQGLLHKTYLAVVRGHMPESGRIDHAMREQQDRLSDVLADKNKPAQQAITNYKRLSTCEIPTAVGRYPSARYSLVELNPETGRKHQLRRHMKHISHHIIGDTTHGDGRHNRVFREQFNCHRLLLAATCLQFEHPVSGEECVVVAQPVNTFMLVAKELGLISPPEEH